MISTIVSIVLLLAGAFFFFFPHSVHISSGLGFGLSHGYHLLLGFILIVIGIIVLILGRKKSSPAQDS